MNTNKKKLKCNFCDKEYVRKRAFKEHQLICEELQKSKYTARVDKEENEDVPSQKDMYTLIKFLIKKNTQLENKVNELTKYVNKTKKRINIINWLNENANRSPDYEEWLACITIDQKIIEYVFKNGFAKGVVYILTLNLPCEKEFQHPIKSFNQNPKVFYIYHKKEWVIMTKAIFKKMICRITCILFREFTKWKEINKEQIKNDDRFYSDVYLTNMNRLLGGTGQCTKMSDDAQEQKNKQYIINNLYTYLRRNIRNIIMYEFSF